ncbi:MAG: gamma carbonic anhydrase family protein [Erysipelotrichaceae bacterium]
MLKKFNGLMPKVNDTCYISDNAMLWGEVILHSNIGIFDYAVLRADFGPIEIGSCSNVQENVSIHNDIDFPVKIGSSVTIGHGAIIHGCTIEDRVVIGMGAIILNGVKISHDCIIGAGSLLCEGMYVPPYSVVVGSPAKVIKTISDYQIKYIENNANEYVKLTSLYLKGE